MFQPGPTLRRLSVALFLVCLFPCVASAQENKLKVPTIAASVAAAADWASTYHALKYTRFVKPTRCFGPSMDRQHRSSPWAVSSM